MTELRYWIRGLDCPNCAAKLEQAILRQEGVREANLDFAQGTLAVRCEEAYEAGMHQSLQAIADRVERGVRIEKEGGCAPAEGSCGCAHAHEHEHEHEHSHDHGQGSVRRERALLAIAAAAFLLALALPERFRPLAFVVSWLLAGGEVLLSSARTLAGFVKSLWRGPLVNPLDENLLMSVATIGACLLGEYAEGAMVMLLFNLGEQLQAAAVRRSRASIEKLMAVRPDHANLLEKGRVRRVSPEEVPAGACIELRPGERIPLDGVVVEGVGALDTRDMTGESLPREVAVGDEVLSGCINLNARLVLRVTRPAGESAVSRALARIQDAAKGRAKAELFFTRFARIYTPVVVGAAFLLGTVPLLFGGDASVWVYRALSFLVVSCPCALVLSIPLSFFCGIGAASRMGVLCKGGAALERLAEARTVAFDKTGTLTKGELSVRRALPAPGVSEEELLRAVASAESGSDHPIAKALAAAARPEPVEELQELAGLGLRCRYAGKTLLVGNRRLLQEAGVDAPELHATGVLAALDGRYLGAVELRDTLHPQARETIEGLRARGIGRIAMLSGDNRAIAEHIAGELGGLELRAELLPDQKVEALESLGEHAVYVGDGVNDAPCLLAADVGVAIGLSGSDAAIEAADVVLLGGGPKGLLAALDIARRTMRNVKQNALFALGAKAAFLLLSALGWCPMWVAVFADAGLAVLCVLNSLRLLAVAKA